MSLHFLIDGYNALYALPELPAGSLEKKRDALLERIAQEKPHGNNRITVVFDSREGSGSQSRWGQIQVVYTAAETADDWLARQVRQIRNPRDTIVVSDDKGIRHMVRGTGAKWISAQEFWRRGTSPRGPRSPARTEIDSEAITEEMMKKWLG